MTATCAWVDCENPAPWRETVANSETGEQKEVDLCQIHREKVWEIDERLFRARHGFTDDADRRGGAE